MALWIVEHHHYHHLDKPMAEALVKITNQLGTIAQLVRTNMIDTSKLLAAVAREKTDNDSLRALVTAATTTMADLSQKLADAIAASDPTAMAAVQADLDKASEDLSLDSDKTEAALAANVPPPPAASGSPAAPSDGSAPAPLGGTGPANPS